jgi:formate dehydrogenase iron-sulfur subunit
MGDLTHQEGKTGGINMNMDRRTFLKLSMAGVGAVALDSAVTLPAVGDGDRLALLYDSSKCVGCRACQMACKQWNKLDSVSTDAAGLYESPKGLSPNVWTLIKLVNYQVNDRRSYLFIKVGCMHCGKPACVEACPTGTLKKQPNGLVTVEQSLCNGCGYCTQACPFHVPQLEVFNQLTGAARASKCTFCQDRVAQGLRPACVQACPVGALDWGGRGAMLAKAKSRLESIKTDFPQAKLYGETELGGLGRLDVLLAPPEVYGLPEDPRFPFGVTVWKKAVHPAGQAIFGATTLGLLGVFFVARRRTRMEEVE